MIFYTKKAVSIPFTPTLHGYQD